MSFWKGNPSQRRRWKYIVGTYLLFVLSKFLWRLSLRLTPYEATVGQMGLILAGLALVCTILAVWQLGRIILWLGIRQSILLVVLIFALVIAINLWEEIEGQSFWASLGMEVRATAIAWIRWPLVAGEAIIRFADEFMFAIDGQQNPPRLPRAFPTPDPKATPVKMIVPKG